MDFRTAVNILGRQITTSDIAVAVGMSPYSIRQARLQEGSAAHRKPPKGWEKTLLHLAQERSAELQDLISALSEEPSAG